MNLFSLEKKLLRRGAYVVGIFFFVYTFRIFYFFDVIKLTESPELVDFDMFYLASRAIWDGVIVQAYHFPDLVKLMERYYGFSSFLLWAYPPPFNLVLAPLGYFSKGVAYALFVGLSMVTWLLIVKRLAGPLFVLPLLMMFPAILMNAANGQNGFVTGSLMGLAMIYALARKDLAGVPLGAMIVKPHLAVTLGLSLLISRRWKVIIIAAVTTVILCAIATVSFGFEIWQAYLVGSKESSLAMKLGLFPNYRMITVYASLRSFNVPAEIALLCQGGVGLAALVAILHSALKLQYNHTIGLAVLANPLLTPYAFDYDLCVATLGIAVLFADFVRHGKPLERIAAYVLAVSASGSGLLLYYTISLENDMVGDLPATISGFLFLALVIIIWRVILRVPKQKPSAQNP